MAITAAALQKAFEANVDLGEALRSKATLGFGLDRYVPPMMNLTIPMVSIDLDLWRSPMLQLAESLNASNIGNMEPRLADVAANMSTGLLVSSLQGIDFTNLVTLPDTFRQSLDGIFARIQAGEDGRTVLAEMNEPWLLGLYNAVEFAAWMDVSSEERQGLLDDFADEVMDVDEFPDALRELVESVDVTRPRWRIINAAIQAHYEQKYLYSVPLLLSQLEGMFADLLVVSRQVKREGGKVYQLDPDTGTVLTFTDSRGRIRPKQVSGLKDLVVVSGLRSSDYLGDFAGYILDHTCTFRNGALHGGALDFDTKQNSYRTAMLLFIVARELQGLGEEISP